MDAGSTVLITGGTGMIGTAIAEALLGKGYTVIILTRNKNHPKPVQHERLILAEWDINNGTIDKEAVGKTDIIIHLAGANVGEKRWTQKRKTEILESRTKTAGLIVQALRTMPNKVRTVISSSAIGWYGPDDKDHPVPFTEEAPPHTDFLGSTCKEWEASIRPVESLGKKLIIFRTGIVLSKSAGAYKEFRKPVSFGLATILGSGKQVVSWIHIDDIVRMYLKAIEDERMSGIYNAVSPVPVTNRELINTIGRAVKGKFYIPVYVPAFILKLVVGEMSIEVLKSATVSCGKIHNTGFTFLFPSVGSAIRHLEGQKNPNG